MVAMIFIAGWKHCSYYCQLIW